MEIQFLSKYPLHKTQKTAISVIIKESLNNNIALEAIEKRIVEKTKIGAALYKRGTTLYVVI